MTYLLSVHNLILVNVIGLYGSFFADHENIVASIHDMIFHNAAIQHFFVRERCKIG